MHFEAVYRDHFTPIWRAIRRFGVPEKDALDAAQEVFLIAYRRQDDFEARSQIKTWLIGIAYRVAANRLRSATARREVLSHDVLQGQVSLSDPHAEVEQHILVELLQAALAYLPLEQRAVFTLFELEELSGDDIAEALGIPVGTVRSRLRLARQAFSRAVKHLSQDAAVNEVSEGGL